MPKAFNHYATGPISVLHGLSLTPFLIFLVACAAWAQTQGEITGLVTDSSGAVVVGAKVMATNVATSATRTTASNDAGVYDFPALFPGLYNLRVELQGFNALVRSVELQVQQVARIDFRLQVGEVTEVVNIAENASLLQTENATVGTVIENKRIVDLPLNGRNYLQMIALSPNVVANFGNIIAGDGRQGGSRVQQSFAVVGLRSEYNHFTLDGMENTDVNFNSYVILPSIDALQEFKVQTGIYPAEFGRQVNQINVSTKPGGNAFHGTLFEFLRNDKLDASIYAFTSNRPRKNPFKWNQYGFTLSGPVLIPKLFNGKNRLFFMTNFEGFRSRNHIRGLYNVPSAAMRGGDFSQNALPLFDPLTRSGSPGSVIATPFPGNIIPTNRFNRTSLKFFEFYPAPNTNTGTLNSNFQNDRNDRTDKDGFITRVDLVENSNSSWFFRYSWGDEQEIVPNIQLNGTNLITHVRQYMIANTRVISSTKVNEFRFGYSNFFNTTGTELAFTRDVMAELNIPGLSLLGPAAWGTPAVNFSEFSGFGDDSQRPSVNNNHVFQWTDNFSWTKSKHTLRFGAEIRRDRYNVLGSSFPRGNFTFSRRATVNPQSTGTTGNSFADFWLGFPDASQTSLKLAQGNFRQTSQAYYFDEVWKVTPRLTLNLGLRYEFTPSWHDKSGFLMNAEIPVVDTTPNVQDLSRHPTLVRMGSGDFYEGLVIRFNPAIKVARDGRLGPNLVRNDYNDFAPRIGVAWSPTNKLTLRMGGGIFYSQDVANSYFDLTRNAAGRRDSFTNPDFPDLTWDHPFGASNAANVLINTPFIPGYDNHRRTPYVVQYTLNIQRELSKNTLLEVGYVGNLGRKLPMFRAFNQALPGATGSAASRSPYPEFSYVQHVSGLDQSTYNALALKVERRFSKGLTYLTGYTFSRTINYDTGLRTHAGENGTPQNNYNLNAERGLSLSHAKNRFVNSLLYELPLGKRKKVFSKGGVGDIILGGWQIGSITTIQSGFPGSVFNGVNRQNDNIGVSRPDAIGLPVALSSGQRGTEKWFNTAAFALPPLGSFGNAGRNVVIGPGLLNLDSSAMKNFHIRENHDLQFRFEMFNFLNHPNWDLPNLTLIDPSFGTIRGTRTAMRQLQFGLKYMF